MPAAAGQVAVPPPIIWAQRSGYVVVTVAVECKDEEYTFTEDSLHFRATGVATGRPYDVTLNFSDKIDADSVTTKKTGQCNTQFHIPRKTPGAYWNSLTTDKKKPHFLKIDFNLWVDESQENEAEDRAGGDLGDLGGMGGGGMPGMDGSPDMAKLMDMFQGQGGQGGKTTFDDMDDGAEDSDDEELPNLE